MADCPKCQGSMEVGQTFVDYWGWRIPLRWADGQLKRSLWTGLSLRGRKHTDVASRRCRECGYIELFAGYGVEEDFSTLEIRAENDRLRKQMGTLLDRVAVLEKIATDPAERTAREIEALRDLPDKDNEEKE